MSRKATAILRDIDNVKKRQASLAPAVYANALAELELELADAYGKPVPHQGAMPLDTPQQAPDAPKRGR